MDPVRRIAGIGDVYVPTQFREIAAEDASWRLFTQSELGQFDRIFTHLRRGGAAIVSGDWDHVMGVMEYIERKKGELVRPSRDERGGAKRSGKHRDRRQPRLGSDRDKFHPARGKVESLSRLMCWADSSGTLRIHPPPDLPYLLEWVGEDQNSNEGQPFLIPLMRIQKIQKALAETYPIRALGISLQASDNVLPPHSQETVELFQRGLQSVKSHLPQGATVLDMGCGCGSLTLLAAQEASDLGARIYASDLLPEAVATTRFNLRRRPDAHSDQSHIHIMPAGDLFETVPALPFDLVIFNAPWVVSRARNRAEIAIHDERQETLQRFFNDLPSYLNPMGQVLIGYADASGAEAINRLETMIDAAGLTTVNRFKERVATHRSKRKWENIAVYELINDKSDP